MTKVIAWIIAVYAVATAHRPRATPLQRALEDLTAELKRQNDFAESIARATSHQAVRALAATMAPAELEQMRAQWHRRYRR